MNPLKAAFVSRAISTWRARGMAFVAAAVLVLAAQAAPSAHIAQATAGASSLTAASSTQQHDRWMADMAGHLARCGSGRSSCPARTTVPPTPASRTAGCSGPFRGVRHQSRHRCPRTAPAWHPRSGPARPIYIGDVEQAWGRDRQLPQDYYIYHGPGHDGRAAGRRAG